MADLKGEAWHIEQRRKSQDLIRVLNPTEQDYILIWDTERFTIPNKNKDGGYGLGMRVMQRYLAEKYVREMKNKLILEKSDAKLAEIKANLAKSGSTEIPFNSNIQLMTAGSRPDDPTLTREYYEILWLGIEEEFGTDSNFMLEPDVKPMLNESDVLNELANKRYTPVKTEEKKPEDLPVYVAKKDRVKHDLSEVAA